MMVSTGFLRAVRLALFAAWVAMTLAARAEQQQQPPSPAEQKRVFDAAKAIGKASASTGEQSIKNGSAGSTTRQAVPYSANPSEASSYGQQDGAAKGSQTKADCRANPSDARCAAINAGSERRDLSATKANDPAFDSQVAISHPDRVLGNIAQTYNACTVQGTGAGATGAAWSEATCAVQSGGWTDMACSKTLSVRAKSWSTCQDGSATVNLRMQDVSREFWVDVLGYCGIGTGGRPMRFDFTVWLGTERPQATDLPWMEFSADLDIFSMIPDNPALPLQLGAFCIPQADGSCREMRLYMEGPGCVYPEACVASFHIAPPPSYELLYNCNNLTATTLGTDIKFDPLSFKPDPATVGSQCFRAFDTKDQAQSYLGPLVKGGVGQRTGDTKAYWWGFAGPISYWRYRWLEEPEHVVDGAYFPQPLAHPAFGDRWDNGCAQLEARTPGLAPDGVSTQLPVMPVLASDHRMQCVRKSSVCLDGPSTRIIEGHAVTRQCWAYSDVFACTPADSASHCPAAAEPNCTRKSSTCVREDGQGHCLESRDEYTCRASVGGVQQQGVNCGDSSYCANGSCWNSEDTTSTQNNNYGQAMGQYQARAEAAKDIAVDPAKVEIFKGRPLHCVRANFGLDNCCSGSTTSQQCNAEENERITLNKQGKCVDVGEYCSRKLLFTCQEKTRTTCCYNSLLARVVQQQGRQQLGLDLGDAKKPVCAGFSPTEFGQLDWSKIDLAEYYAQLKLDPKPLDPADAQTAAGNAQAQCYYGEGRC